MNSNRWGKASTTPIQQHYHFSFWEDYRNGILAKRCSSDGIDNAKKVLSNPNRFLKLGRKMLSSWPQCTGQYLSDKSINRRAYLGAVVCNYAFGSSEREVRLAWWELSQEQRARANDVADHLLKEFECLRKV